MKTFHYTISAACFLLGISCGGGKDAPCVENFVAEIERIGVDELDANRTLWDENHPNDYVLEYQTWGGRTVVTVENDTVISVFEESDYGYPVEVTDGLNRTSEASTPNYTAGGEIDIDDTYEYFTVEGLFDLVHVIDQGLYNAKLRHASGEPADYLEVHWDSGLGYPTDILVDPFVMRCGVCSHSCVDSIDEEYNYEIIVTPAP